MKKVVLPLMIALGVAAVSAAASAIVKVQVIEERVEGNEEKARDSMSLIRDDLKTIKTDIRDLIKGRCP